MSLHDSRCRSNAWIVSTVGSCIYADVLLEQIHVSNNNEGGPHLVHASCLSTTTLYCIRDFGRPFSAKSMACNLDRNLALDRQRLTRTAHLACVHHSAGFRYAGGGPIKQGSASLSDHRRITTSICTTLGCRFWKSEGRAGQSHRWSKRANKSIILPGGDWSARVVQDDMWHDMCDLTYFCTKSVYSSSIQEQNFIPK